MAEIKWNLQGFYDLRSAPGVRADLERRMTAIKEAAEAEGGQYVMGSQQGEKRPQGRWRTSLVTADVEAMKANGPDGDSPMVRALSNGRN